MQVSGSRQAVGIVLACVILLPTRVLAVCPGPNDCFVGSNCDQYLGDGSTCTLDACSPGGTGVCQTTFGTRSCVPLPGNESACTAPQCRTPVCPCPLGATDRANAGCREPVRRSRRPRVRRATTRTPARRATPAPRMAPASASRSPTVSRARHRPTATTATPARATPVRLAPASMVPPPVWSAGRRRVRVTSPRRALPAARCVPRTASRRARPSAGSRRGCATSPRRAPARAPPVPRIASRPARRSAALPPACATWRKPVAGVTPSVRLTRCSPPAPRAPATATRAPSTRAMAATRRVPMRCDRTVARARRPRSATTATRARWTSASSARAATAPAMPA